MKNRMLVASVIWLSVFLAGAEQPKHNQSLKPTAVIHYTPPDTLPDMRRAGSCWTRSIAAPYRADAWRCTEGNAIHDPCFAVLNKQVVACGADPTAHSEGFQLTLTKPLPKAEAHALHTPKNWAWLVQLSDGTVCTPFTGTRPFIGGQVGYYGCTSANNAEQIMLLGDLDGRHSVWTAKKAIVVKSGSNWSIESTAVVPVKAVWQ